jgi:hypothetical protein
MMADICKVCNDISEASYLYGGEDYILTDDDLELLKNGAILNFFVNDEYGCTIRYQASNEVTDPAKGPAAYITP